MSNDRQTNANVAGVRHFKLPCEADLLFRSREHILRRG